MESAGEDYREGFTDLTYGEFVREYADKLIANYVREQYYDILQETEFFDFVGREYKENHLVEFDEDYNVGREDEEDKEDIY